MGNSCVSLRTAVIEQLSKANDLWSWQRIVLDLFSNFTRTRSSGYFWGQVITLRGPFLVSGKVAMKDEPNIRLRCSRNVLFFCLFSR